MPKGSLKPDADFGTHQHHAKNEAETLRRLIAEMQEEECENCYSDSNDLSCHASYTEFGVPYHMHCALRYAHSKQKYERQFRHELNQIIRQLGSAFETARLMRHVSLTTLWPPFHNRREIVYTGRNVFYMPRKHRKRLEYLMTTNIT